MSYFMQEEFHKAHTNEIQHTSFLTFLDNITGESSNLTWNFIKCSCNKMIHEIDHATCLIFFSKTAEITKGKKIIVL